MPSTPRNPSAGSAPSLLVPILLCLSPAHSSGEEKGPLRGPEAGRCLALKLDVGNDFTFLATDEVEKRKIEYRMVVRERGEKGAVTLAVVGFFIQRADMDSPPGPPDARGTILSLSGEGRVEGIARHLPPVPRAFETHLRLVFGSGLHALPLDEQRVYRLEPLLALSDGSESLQLRFEGLVVEDNRELARFTVLKRSALATGDPAKPEEERRQAPPPAPGNLRVVGAAGEDSGISPTLRARANARVPLEEWVLAGEATYRTADGVLQAARLEGPRPNQPANDSEPAQLSIRRMTPPGQEQVSAPVHRLVR